MAGANPWLQRQRKSDLVEIATHVGLKDFEALRKNDLEVQLDEFISENASRFSSDPKLAGYYNSRARAIGSPVKKEAPHLGVAKRRATKAHDEIVPADDDEPATRSSSTALVQTPARGLSLERINLKLPASPADISQAISNNTIAVRHRITSLYQDSGITEVTHATRDSLSTVTSILFLVHLFEAYFLRKEVLADRYAFTIPAISYLGTNDYPVHVPDVFLLLTTSFWSPVLLYAFTSVIIPSLVGYFFNLSAANHSHPGRGRARANQTDYSIDPLTSSIAKALITFVVYNQGVTFNGLIDELSVARINSALYGGWKGVVAGAAITGLTAIYDAVLKK